MARPTCPAPNLAYLPFGLLQPRPEFPLLPLKGSAAALQLLSLLQQLCEVILQLALLLLQLEHLQLQQLLGPLDTLCGLLRLGCTVLPLPWPVPLPRSKCLEKRRQARNHQVLRILSSSLSCLGLGDSLPGLKEERAHKSSVL